MRILILRVDTYPSEHGASPSRPNFSRGQPDFHPRHIYSVTCQVVRGSRHIWPCNRHDVGMDLDLLLFSQARSAHSTLTYCHSQVATLFLFAFDGLKQGFEISFSKSLAAVSFNQLDKERWTVHQRAGENLQKIAFLVPIY